MEMNGMSWEEYKRECFILPIEDETKVNVKCPECGELIYQDNTVICASNPPKSKYFCKKCKWVGYK